MGQRLLILFLALFVASAYGGLGGEGLGLYRISLDKESQQHLRVPVREKLRELLVDVWRSGVDSADFSSPAEVAGEISRAFPDAKLETVVEDLAETIKNERQELDRRREARLSNDEGPRFGWTEYYTLQEIYDYFDELAATYDHAEIDVMGTSYEGRDIRVLKVCRDGCNEEKPAVYVQADIHAREWVSAAVLTYLANQLLEESPGADWTDRFWDLDWYFVSNVNPDGYEYTWTTDRLWRKTRSINDGDLCVGVDANRNYDYHWELGGTLECCTSEGVSCSNDYKGPSVWSEGETRASRDFVLAHSDRIKLFIGLHSYGQLVLLPYGDTEEYPPDIDDMLALTNEANDNLVSNGAPDSVPYTVGSFIDLLYPATGSSSDWAYDSAGIKYSFTIELRPEDAETLEAGFLLPPDQILPNAIEVNAFLRSAALQVLNEYEAEEEQRK